MVKFIIPAALALLASTPALADEGRVEIRGGYTSIVSLSEAVVGIAAGYDADVGGKAFVGGEVSVDKVLNGGFDEVYGITGRAGIKVTEDARIFVAGGHSFGNGDSWHAGIGAEHNLGSNVYAKLEHRRNFTNFGFDFDTTVIGFGIKF